MMISQIDKSLYGFLFETELYLLLIHKLDPFALELEMSMFDFQTLIDSIIQRTKEEDKRYNQSGTLLKQLVYMRNLLNSMKLPEEAK